MFAPLILAAALATMAQAAEPAASSPVEAVAPGPSRVSDKPVAKVDQAVDANGVPAWAKRKHYQPVQSCETKEGISVETWRARYEPTRQGKAKTTTPQAACH